MTKKRQWGFLLLVLLAIFAVRCSFSISYFQAQGRSSSSYNRSPIRVFESPFVGAPALNTNVTSPPANNTRISHQGSNSTSRHDGNSSFNSTKTSGDDDDLGSLVDDDPVISAYPTVLTEIHKVPKIQPIWKYLVNYLRRPKVPKDATKAMREGLRAWKEINKTMVAEANERANSSSHKFDAKCPYFVSALNATELKSEPFLLPIPCGLVLDSSVTVVGTPGVRSGDFSLELIGSELFQEGDEPVVFHFSVRLRGDQLSENPTIVQNTWTVAGDWQMEQRCPVLADCADCETGKVDGLKTCNSDIGQNITRKAGPGLWKGINVPEGSVKTWFPFAEGFPFVVTISAGWDGFHVSVNGKHVTSFKYRQSLEPWMVNSLRIKGDLQTSSVIVNGLPISDDVSLIPDLKVIRAPKLPKKATLLIGVFSSNSNFVRRMAVRRTWMQYPEVRNGTVVVRFFVGLHQNTQVNKELWTESLTYGDMQILPMVDYYNIITYKTLAICMYAEYNLKTDFVMKTDDDTFLRVDAVLSTIFESKQNSTHSLFLGNLEFAASPERDPSNKWFVNREEWGNDTYPPWAHGPGYIMSQDIAHFVVEGHQKNLLKFFKLEDVAMGIWVDQYKRQKHKVVDYVTYDSYQHGMCENGFTISHYQNPSQMQCLWNNEMEGEHGICCNNDI